MNNINKTVNVTAFRFKKNQELYPQRIEVDGEEFNFVDTGLSCKIRRAGQLSTILTMTDGLQQFRLRRDDRGGIWTLLSMSA